MDTTPKRGYQAALEAFTKSPKGGGGVKSPRGAVNACHRVLAKAGRPMSAKELVVHITGLGYWTTQSQSPVNTIIGPLNMEAKKDDGVLSKPESGKSVFVVREGATTPLQPIDADTPDPDHLAAVEAGTVPALEAVKAKVAKAKGRAKKA